MVTAELGDTWSTIQDILTKTPKYIDVIGSVLEDPALDAVVARVKTLAAIEKATPRAAPTTAPVTAPIATTAGKKGIGLSVAIRPLDLYIWYKNNKWVLPVGIAGVVLVLGGIGFTVGRLSKRCKR